MMPRRLAIVAFAIAACASPPSPSPSPLPSPSPSPSPTPSPSPSPSPSPTPSLSPTPTPSPSPTPTPSPTPADLIDPTTLIPDAVLDIRYATDANFTKAPLYPAARCLLRRAVAERLARAAELLRAEQRRLLLWDCYRPASVQRELWRRVPDPRYVAEPRFAADGTPLSGSRHSRGAAVDIALVAADGAPVALPTAHDDFSRRAHRDRALPASVEARRLDRAMLAAGFVAMPTEWWHYDAPDWRSYPLSDEPLTDPAP